ncbi:MAG: hypothetical protein ACXVA9_00560 [Bdellovibrionales bacterium]
MAQVKLLQDFMIDIIVDPILFSRFKKNPAGIALERGFTLKDAETARNFDITQLQTFVDVITATRTNRFNEAYRHLRRILTETQWADLLLSFFSTVAVPHNQNYQDFKLFNVHVEATYSRLQTVLDAAKLDLASYKVTVATTDLYPTLPKTDVIRRKKTAEGISLKTPLETLLTNGTSTQLNDSFVLVCKNLETGELDYYEVEPDHQKIWNLLPASRGELAAALPSLGAGLENILNEFQSIGAV